MKEYIHVVFALYDPKGSYSQHIAVVMASILHNTKSAVCFHILHDETLTADNRRKLAWFNSEKASVNFVDVSSYFMSSGIDIDKICRQFSRGTLYRLVIQDVLPIVNKVVYLDADVVVTLDMNDLWQESLGENTIGAVLDSFAEQKHKDNTKRFKVIKQMGIDRSRYFGAGVIVMDLEKMRSESKEKSPLLERAVECFKKYDLLYPDQDFLNKEYAGRVFYLDERYNWTKSGDSKVSRIWHFPGDAKPWREFKDNRACSLYWRYLLQTSWADKWDEQLYNAATYCRHYHRRSSDCIKRLWRQLKENIFKGHCWRFVL